MNNRKATKGRIRKYQIIEKWEDVPCPRYGHRAGDVPNYNSNVSTHYYSNGVEVPHTIRKCVSRKTIIHTA